MKAPEFNDNNGGDFEPCPPGVYAACLVRLIDKGSRQESYQGGPMAWKRKILLGFEICDDETRMSDGKPFMAYREFGFTMHEKGALRPFIAGWRGSAFTDQEARDFDFSKLLGAFAMVNVIHKTRTDGTTRAEMQSISKLPRGMTPAARVNEPVLFDCDKPDLVILGKLGKRTVESIEASPEFRAAMGEAPPRPTPAPSPAPAPTYSAATPDRSPGPAAAVDFDDDIPF